MSDALDPAAAQRFREAGELYRAGRLAEAERLLEEIVAVERLERAVRRHPRPVPSFSAASA